MKEKEKSLELSKLMGWDVTEIRGNKVICNNIEFQGQRLEPYAQSSYGLAQFAAILLKFPLAMQQMTSFIGIGPWLREPTQSNILDEILRMSGVKL